MFILLTLHGHLILWNGCSHSNWVLRPILTVIAIWHIGETSDMHMKREIFVWKRFNLEIYLHHKQHLFLLLSVHILFWCDDPQCFPHRLRCNQYDDHKHNCRNFCQPYLDSTGVLFANYRDFQVEHGNLTPFLLWHKDKQVVSK